MTLWVHSKSSAYKYLQAFLFYNFSRLFNRLSAIISACGQTPHSMSSLILFADLRQKKIYTDRLRNYSSLIDHSIHCISLYSTNHIERHNLTLRTHLKRLSRKTICFSRSAGILSAILKIYFWGPQKASERTGSPSPCSTTKPCTALSGE